MSYLLDTNVISELTKPNPNANVIQWVNNINEADLHLSAITIGELRKGIERLTNKDRKAHLVVWLEQSLIKRFDKRILDINIDVAERWGRLLANTEKTLPAIDSLIAATALHYDLCVVTRNTNDFRIETLEVVNPWAD